MGKRIDWMGVVVPRALEIIGHYDTLVTLRQLFYRLVSEFLIPNTRSAYATLSSRTAALRRAGEFPSLLDKTRGIVERTSFPTLDAAYEYIHGRWGKSIGRDRTAGQEFSIYLGVEKEGIVEQLRYWFGDLGMPILPLRGYTSESFEREVLQHIDSHDYPSVLLYAGDFDPSGEDILRNFTKHVHFDEVIRVALTEEQVREHALPMMMGKATDTRAAGFVARHGELVQVELDALPPDVLRGLYQDELDRYWDPDAYEAVLEQEQEEKG